MLFKWLRAMFTRRKKRTFPNIPTNSRDCRKYYADTRTRRQL
jgi:hypothetical protein